MSAKSWCVPPLHSLVTFTGWQKEPWGSMSLLCSVYCQWLEKTPAIYHTEPTAWRHGGYPGHQCTPVPALSQAKHFLESTALGDSLLIGPLGMRRDASILRRPFCEVWCLYVNIVWQWGGDAGAQDQGPWLMSSARNLASCKPSHGHRCKHVMCSSSWKVGASSPHQRVSRKLIWRSQYI